MEDEMVGWHHWLNGHEFEQNSWLSKVSQLWEMVKDRETCTLQSMGSQRIFNLFFFNVFLIAVGLCGAQALHWCMWVFSSGRGYPLVECMGFSCCGSWASWPQGMWDLSSQTRDQTHVHVSLNLCSNNHMGLEVVILDTSPRTWDTKISGENWNIYEDFSGRNWVSLFWWILYFLVRVIWNSSNSRIVRKTTSTLFVFAFFFIGI